MQHVSARIWWRVLLGGWLAAAVLLPATGPLEAADKKSSDTTVLKTEDGLRFQLPADWPVEKRSGVVGPIPVEEYLSRKFEAIENRLRALDQQTGSLDVRMRVMEEQQKKQQSGLKSGSAP